MGEPFVDVPGKGGVSPPCAAGEVPGPDGAGVDLPAVVDQHLGVVGDHDLLCAPAVQQFGRLRPVREAGEDLRLRRVGLEEADIGQQLLLLRPVVVHHAAVLHTAEHALHVDGYLGMLCGVGDQLIGQVAPHQSRQMPDGGVHRRDLLRPVGVDHAGHRGGPPLPVRCVIDILRHEGSPAGKGIHRDVGSLGKGRPQLLRRHIRLGQHGGPVADVGGGKAGVVNGAANRLDRGAVIVHIRIQRHLADDQRVKGAHFRASFRMSSSAWTNSENSGPHSWKRPASIIRR